MSEYSEMKKKVAAIAERMDTFFVGTNLESASREIVEKWSAEIRASLRYDLEPNPREVITTMAKNLSGKRMAK
jgi:hypothetical protein